MASDDTKSTFEAKLLRPADPGAGAAWAFVVLPKAASAKLPRRGRITVHGNLNGRKFTGCGSTGSCSRHRALGLVRPCASRFRLRSRNPNRMSRPISSRPCALPRRRARFGTRPPRSRASTGSTGSPRPSRRRRARSASATPATCSLRERSGCVASIPRDSIARRSARQRRRMTLCEWVPQVGSLNAATGPAALSGSCSCPWGRSPESESQHSAETTQRVE
jgi:hypothetical protein